jgi:hypothetical protein
LPASPDIRLILPAPQFHAGATSSVTALKSTHCRISANISSIRDRDATKRGSWRIPAINGSTFGNSPSTAPPFQQVEGRFSVAQHEFQSGFFVSPNLAAIAVLHGLPNLRERGIDERPRSFLLPCAREQMGAERARRIGRPPAALGGECLDPRIEPAARCATFASGFRGTDEVRRIQGS